MNILGIETSCDETGVAIYNGTHGLLAHALHSQIQLHRRYGGVVPELASRDHIRKLLPLVQQVLADAQLELPELDGVAYTAGPGLVGALLVGAGFARSLGWALGIPTVGIHHMEGHLLAPMLEPDPPHFPFLALLVSGGHTLLVAVQEIGCYRLLGESLDDAVGEAFDKTAKLLGLPYPGGPELARLAKQGRSGRFYFPRPMLQKPNLDFSFSGLKTHVRSVWLQSDRTVQTKADIAHAFQEAVVETLVVKSQRALKQTGLKRLVVAGGVGANQRLREEFQRLAKEQDYQIYFPRLEFCTDNGAMIAYAGYCRLAAGQQDDLVIQAKPRWPLTKVATALTRCLFKA